MTIFTRRSVLRGSLGLAAAGALVRPHIANAAATTAEVWWTQGFAQEEDIAFKKLVADYQKASGNKIEDSIIPFAPLRQKEVSAIASGIVPDVMEIYDLEFAPLHSWDDKLVDVSDIVETQKADFLPIAIDSCSLYNNATKNAAITWCR
jgi:multiple sugar transport system substrate-binding protein